MCDNTVMQAEVMLLAGRADDALRVIEDGKQICSELGERTLEPELHRLQGEALELNGDREAALAATERAATRAAELNALSLELRAVTQLHRWSLTAESLERLRETYLKFSEGFDMPDLRLARSYLDSEGGVCRASDGRGGT
jgi:predicted Zn-dependent protease